MSTPTSPLGNYQYAAPPPWEHQLRAQAAAGSEGGLPRRAGRRTGFAYLMEMRTGKSRTVVDEFCALYEAGELDGVLILAPKGVYRSWTHVSDPDDPADEPGHLQKAMPDRVWRHARVRHWLPSGGPKYHQELLLELLDTEYSGLRVLVMNSEALSTGTRGYDFAARFLRSCQTGMLVVDESVDFADASSSRTLKLIGDTRRGRKPIVGLRDLATYRRILNGLLSPRDPLQVWSQFEILEPGCLGFGSFWAFKTRYAVLQQKDFGGRRMANIVVGFRNQEDLQARVARHSFRVRKDECWDLPRTIYSRREIELTPEQRRLYEEIALYATAQLDAETHVTATAVITQILRLQQLVCGHVVDESGAEHDVPSNRIEELLRIGEETDDKIVVWSGWVRPIRKIVAALGERYGPASVVAFYGEVADDDRQEAIRRFQHDSEVRWFVGNQFAGGRGIKLTAARTMVYFANRHSLDKRRQSEERAEGHEQTERGLACIDLVAPGTVDERILRALRANIDLSSLIMGDGYREWLLP